MRRIAVAFFLLFALVGCAQTETLAPSPTIPQPTEEPTIAPTPTNTPTPTAIPTPTEIPLPEDMAAIIERGSIRVGGFLSPFEPFSDADAQSPQGFEPAILNILITDVLGDAVNIEWVPTLNYLDGLERLHDGKIDLLIRNTSHTVSSEADGLWTIPYFIDGQRILVKSDANLTEWADLDGQPICSDGGPLKNNLINQMAEHGITIEVVDSRRMANTTVRDKCTAITHIWSTLLVWGYEYTAMDSETPDWVSLGDLLIGEIDGTEIGYDPLAIGVTLDAPGLHEAINAALIAMIEDGRWQDIYDEWIHDPAPWTPADLLTAAPAMR